MTVDLSAVKSAKELSTAISGNASVPAQEEQATPLENWREQEYIALHNQIMAHGRNACESILYMAQDLKRMNTEKLYEAGGYASFEEYTEKAVGLKKTQAYKYISAYDSLGEEFFRSSGKIGMPANFEIEDTQIGLSDFWSLIQKEGRSASGHCVSPLRAAELIAEKLGAKFERASRRYGGKPAVRSLEDFHCQYPGRVHDAAAAGAGI